jgi:hypothetical protein
MAKKKPQIDDALTTSEAPEAAPAKKVVPLPVFQGFEATPEPEGMQDVWLIGGGPLDGAYRIPIRSQLRPGRSPGGRLRVAPPLIVFCGVCRPTVEMLQRPSGIWVCPNCRRVKLSADPPKTPTP